MQKVRSRLTYANVMSSIAVFLVLGGATAFAAAHVAGNSIGSKQLKKGSVHTGKIKEGAVTAAKIANNNIINSKLADGAVTTSKIANANVTTPKLATGAVTTPNLANNAVTGPKINLSTLGTVPSAQNLKGYEQFPLTRVSATQTFANYNEGLEKAAHIKMFSAGPFSIYSVCFIAEGRTTGATLIQTTEKAIFYSYEGNAYGSEEYLEPESPAQDRELEERQTSSGSATMNNFYSSSYQAIATNGTTIYGYVPVAVSGGNLGRGNGPYGPGPSCLFYGNMTVSP